METIVITIAIGLFVAALWAHGYSYGNLKGFRQGCKMWRPAYYRVWRLYLESGKDLYSLIKVHSADAGIKALAQDAIDRTNAELADLPPDATP